MAAITAAAALLAALAAEDAAIFGYGVAGAHLTGSRQDAAEQDWTAHNEAREQLTALLFRLGPSPVAAPAACHDLPARRIAGPRAGLLPASFPGTRRDKRDGARGLPGRRRDPGLPRPGRGQRSAAAGLRRAGHAGPGGARRVLAPPPPGLPRPASRRLRSYPDRAMIAAAIWSRSTGNGDAAGTDRVALRRARPRHRPDPAAAGLPGGGRPGPAHRLGQRVRPAAAASLSSHRTACLSGRQPRVRVVGSRFGAGPAFRQGPRRSSGTDVPDVTSPAFE